MSRIQNSFHVPKWGEDYVVYEPLGIRVTQLSQMEKLVFFGDQTCMLPIQ